MGGKPSAQRSAIRNMRILSRACRTEPSALDCSTESTSHAVCEDLAKARGEPSQISGGCGTAGVEDIPKVGIPANVLGINAGFDVPSTEIASSQNNPKREGAVTSKGGTAVDGNAEAKPDNNLEVFDHAQNIQVESLVATTCHAVRDVNVTFSHTSHKYYLSPQPQVSPDTLTGSISPFQVAPSIASIRRELSSMYHEFGAALAELKAHTNNNSAIGQKFQDLYERMGPLQSVIYQPTHFAQPVGLSSAGGHYHCTAQATSSRLAVSDRAIAPEPRDVGTHAAA